MDEGWSRRLLAAQMPDLAGRPLRLVEPWGTDNAIWRLGDDLVVRLPRIRWAAGRSRREATVAAAPRPASAGDDARAGRSGRAGPRLPLPVGGAPLGAGRGGGARPDGGPGGVRPRPGRRRPGAAGGADRRGAGGQEPGAPAARLRRRDAGGRRGRRPPGRRGAGLAVWEEALAARRTTGRPVWVQGDLEGNCLVRDGPALRHRRLGVRPAPATRPSTCRSCGRRCSPTSPAGRSSTPSTSTTPRWPAARGAAVNQACAALPYYLDTYPLIVERSWHKLAVPRDPAALAARAYPAPSPAGSRPWARPAGRTWLGSDLRRDR